MLDLDRVSVQYPGADTRPALRGVSLSVAAGERVALVGPSGAGKSTLLAVAAGLVVPTTGTVRVLGIDSNELGRRRHRTVRGRIGVIPQDFGLVGPLSAASNVAAGRLGQRGWFGSLATVFRPGPMTAIDEVLGTVGIADKRWHRADSLSGGERQRTAIARTVFQRPDLILADEPISALDPARSTATMTLLAEQVADGNRALVTSMHDAELALAHCDRIVALCDGSVEFDRPAAEVTASMLSALYQLQQ